MVRESELDGSSRRVATEPVSTVKPAKKPVDKAEADGMPITEKPRDGVTARRLG
jgi:hypothetical protein